MLMVLARLAVTTRSSPELLPIVLVEPLVVRLPATVRAEIDRSLVVSLMPFSKSLKFCRFVIAVAFYPRLL